MNNEANKKVDAHGICGRPMANFSMKSRVHGLINTTMIYTSAVCRDIVDNTMLSLQAGIANEGGWFPNTPHDGKPYIVKEIDDVCHGFVDRLRFTLHDNLISIDITLNTSGETFIAAEPATALIEVQLRKCFLLRVQEFDIPVTLTVNKYDGSGLFEFHYEPVKEL